MIVSQCYAGKADNSDNHLSDFSGEAKPPNRSIHISRASLREIF
jgi:hypothetical protein